MLVLAKVADLAHMCIFELPQEEEQEAESWWTRIWDTAGLVLAAIRSFGKDTGWRSSTILKGSAPRLLQPIALRLASLSSSSAGATFCKMYGVGGLPCSTLEP